MQSLLMAFEGVRTKLESSGKLLSWVGGDFGDIGIPRQVPSYYGRGFSKELEAMIDRRLEEFARAAEAAYREREGG